MLIKSLYLFCWRYMNIYIIPVMNLFTLIIPLLHPYHTPIIPLLNPITPYYTPSIPYYTLLYPYFKAADADKESLSVMLKVNTFIFKYLPCYKTNNKTLGYCINLDTNDTLWHIIQIHKLMLIKSLYLFCWRYINMYIIPVINLFTLIIPLLHPYYTPIIPLLYPYYTLIIPLLYPYYTPITPYYTLLYPYFKAADADKESLSVMLKVRIWTCT
jgi:hypothetical protein